MRLFDNADLYADSGCPILITKGEPFALAPSLVVHNGTKPANRALRWALRIHREMEDSPTPRLAVIWRDERERSSLVQEAHVLADTNGVAVQIEAVPARDGLSRVFQLAKELHPGVVAMPTRPFPRPLRLHMVGIDARLPKRNGKRLPAASMADSIPGVTNGTRADADAR